MSFLDELNSVRNQALASQADSRATQVQTAAEQRLAEAKEAFISMDAKIGETAPNMGVVKAYLMDAARAGKSVVLITELTYYAKRVAEMDEPKRSETLRSIARSCPNLLALLGWTDDLGVCVTFHGVRKNDQGQGRSWTEWYLALSAIAPDQSSRKPLGMV
jgi:hypothetical protein